MESGPRRSYKACTSVFHCASVKFMFGTKSFDRTKSKHETKHPMLRNVIEMIQRRATSFARRTRSAVHFERRSVFHLRDANRE
jgi:hypothetical protein